MAPLALGLVPHTGWAAAVAVAPGPRVAWRGKLTAVARPEGRFLYHLAAERAVDEAEAFLATAEAEAREATVRAVAGLLAELRAGGQTPAAAAVVGKQLQLPPLAKVLAAHTLIHAAEGELWRLAFADACAAGGLVVHRVLPGPIDAAWLEGSREHKAAAAAAAALL